MKFFERFKSKPNDQQPVSDDSSSDDAIEKVVAVDDVQVDEPAENQVTSELDSTKPPELPDTAMPDTEPLSGNEMSGNEIAEIEPIEQPKKKSLFSRLKEGLKRTGANFSEGMGNLFLGEKEIDDELLEELETQLLVADIGVEATREIMNNLANRASRKELANGDALYQALQEELAALLMPSFEPLEIDSNHKPYVILMVGVNGVGKTTTIGKLTKRFQSQGKSVMLAAGDTFRAAAVEQLQVWGERHNVPVIAQHTGADSASVIFDGVQAAKSRNIDVLIADTAGRLHNKDNLMEELRKVVRVMQKLDDTAPHEVMLVLDAGTGQNAMTQAASFQKVVGVTGITLTKLDGTAKGGIIFAISKQLQLPIRFIGVGEQAEDLRPFVIEEFVAALFDKSGPEA